MNNLWLTFIGRIGFIFLSLLVLTACGGDSSASSANSVGTGTGGSKARFTIQNNLLITLEDRSITASYKTMQRH
jgi:hypothetical protein